jgi:hypothetical protein
MKQANMLHESGEIEIVRDLLMHRIEQRKPMIREEGRAFTLRMQTRAASSALDTGEDDLYVHLAASSSGRLPSRTSLKYLQTTLPLISDAVYAAQAKCIRISGGAHLSAALALGAALPETRFGHVEVIGADGNVWKSSADDRYVCYDNLHIRKIQTGLCVEKETSRRVAVFVTLTPAPDYTAFEHMLQDATKTFAEVEIISIEGEDRINPLEGGNLSSVIARQIKLFASEQGRPEVHLAFHGPCAMAVLIGRYLNTLRTVVYEWDDGITGIPCYKPSVILESSVKDGPIVKVLMD